MNYLLHVLILVSLYSVVAMSLNLLAGYTGLLSICQAAFFGTGAYATALLTMRSGMAWPEAAAVGIIVSGVLALMIGVISLRFRGDYFVIATFAFQVIVYDLMQNWDELTEGPLGLAGIPRPVILGWMVSSYQGFLTLAVLGLVLALLVLHRTVSAPFGRVLLGISEDETFCQSLGKNTRAYKLTAFVLGGVFSAGAGSLYSSYIGYIDPTSFDVQQSIFILAIVIIGGAGNLWGSLLGAGILVAAPEALRFVGIQSSAAANVRQIMYGTLLVACMLWRPQGLLGQYSFGKSRMAG